jgi:uncharacterized protein involved in exopolysaccharide biosynthesis
LLILSVLAGAACFGASYLIPPTFTSETSFLVPQQSSSATGAALATLSALSGLSGGGGANRNTSDQYAALLQSRWIADRLIDRFNLMQVYAVKYRFEARRALEANTRITPGKRDGLIAIAFDDTSPQRAAEMASAYIEELRLLTDKLALTEAQQRRAFFDREVERTRARLSTAQRALQASGFDERTLRAEPRSTADVYARARAELTAADIRLAALRRSLTDSAPEVQQQQAVMQALREQLKHAEQAIAPSDNTAYLDRYRDFKYEEGVLEFLTRQQEGARLDESREGSPVQVVDPAAIPEWKSKPKRLMWALFGGIGALVALTVTFIAGDRWRAAKADPGSAIHRLAQGRRL